MEESTVLDQQSPPSSRPTFLTVLCILTFIGSGWGIIESTIELFTAETTVSTMDEITDEVEEAMDEAGDEEAVDFVEEIMGGLEEHMTVDNIQNSAIGNIIACVFTLIGAFFMWGLQRKGYYLYILGILITIAVPLIIFNGSLIGALGAGGAGFIGLVFIVLYGVNLKHMN